MYKVIASGSKGNAILYNNSILVDCGIPFSMLKPYLYDIQLVLLTHKHGDHFNESTLNKLVYERPTLRIGCCEWFDDLKYKNVDNYKIGSIYNYEKFLISPVKLYHDVPNCGYRIFICDGKSGEYKIFHATDTEHLKGIEAKNYDIYAIESNYDEDSIETIIKNKISNGQYAYEKGAINSHLSEQQARDFIFKNAGENYEVVRLHETSLVK